MNVVMTGDGRFVEVQGTAEGRALRPRRCWTRCSTRPPQGCADLAVTPAGGARRHAAGARA